MIRESMQLSVPTAEVLGVPIACISMEETIDFIDRRLQAGEPSVIVTADSSGLVMAQEDSELREIYRGAALATPDSAGVVWALHRKGAREVMRVSGVEILDRLCGLSAKKGYRIYFLGSAPGVAELAAERLRLKHPGCNIVGTRHGFFTPDDDDLVAQEVAETKPDILIVAMGIPRQEKFIARTMGTIGAKVAMGVGGSLDVFSGKAKRAPKPVQRLHLEWLWRVLLNPKKISKVKLLPRFALMVLRSKR